MQKIIFALTFLAAMSSSVLAQEELGAHLMRGAWTANRSNPALLPDYKFVIGLPGIYNNLRFTNITYSDLIVEQAGGGSVLDINNAISQLGEQNLIRENFDIETISLAVRLGKFTLSAGHTLRFGAYINYPKTLPQLIWQGNSQFVGETVPFGPDLHLQGYNELYGGLAMQLGKHLTLGARVKLLGGLSDVSTERHKLELTTDTAAYALTLDADFLANSSGTVEYDGFDNLTVNFDFGNFNTRQFFSGNNGLAFDIGARLQLGRWDAAASITDFGKIDWTENVKNFGLKGVSEFKGLDVAQSILDDSTDVGSVLDTLRNLYEPTETSAPYTTHLAPRIYLSATYQFNDTWRFGGMFYTENYREQNFPAFALSAHARVLRVLEIGALYAYRAKRFDNIGVNVCAQLGPVQLVASTDNLITAFQLKKSHSANVRIGMSLTFGKIEQEDNE